MRLRLAGIAVVAVPLLFVGPEATSAALSAGGVRAQFDAAGVALASGDRIVAMHLAGIGRAGTVYPLAAVHPRTDAGGVHYVRDGVDEWYREDEHGLEQGFTLDRAPSGTGEVTLDLAIAGARSEKSATGVRLRAVDKVITVEGLSVVDADGQKLAAHMESNDHGFAIAFDDRLAKYPVVVDPYYATETKFVPSGAGTLDSGCSFAAVRSFGTRVYVGMTCPNWSTHSAVYVLRWNGSALTEEARIEPSDASSLNEFGSALDVDETALRVAIGAKGANKAYVYVNTGSAWTLEASLPAPTGSVFGDGISYGANGSGGDLVVWGYPNRIFTYSRSGSTYTYINNINLGPSGSPVSQHLAVRQHRIVTVSGGTSAAGAAVDSFVYTTTWVPDTRIGTTTAAVTSVAASGSSFLMGNQLYVLSGSTFSLQNTFTGASNYSISGDNAIGGGASSLSLFSRSGSTWTALGTMATALNPKSRVALIDATRSVSINNNEIDLNVANPSKVNGAACTAAAECTSYFCVDGVCCDGSCTGSCVACTTAKKGSGVDGVCGNVPNGSTGRGGCPNAMTTCGADGLCDGTGRCRVGAAAGTSCGTTVCMAGSVTGPTCTGTGTCSTAPKSCAPYACKDATSCANACATDADCTTPNVCVAGVCRGKLANGETTASAAVCTSGFAADGVCCDTKCDGACVACTSAKTGGANGTCAAITKDTDPDSECKARCMGASIVDKGSCDGAGKCTEGALRSCAPYGCESGACKTTCFDDSDCAGAKCVAGSCTTTVPDAGSIATDGGVPLVTGTFQGCTSPSDCASGFCVDGVCCDSACNETCRACNLPFAPGRCAIVPAGLDPKHSCGADRTCSNTCDGAGACMATRPGDQCAGAKCVDRSHGVGPAVCPAAEAACPSDTTPFDCGAYACVAAFGACATRCGGSGECAAGFVCDTSNGQCAAAPSSDDGGCAFGQNASSPIALLALLACAVGLVRRRVTVR